VLYGAGNLAFHQGDNERAAALLGESLAVFREEEDTLGMAWALNDLGLVAYGQGDYERAAALFEDSLALKRRVGDRRDIAGSLNNVGHAATTLGDFERAAALLGESLALAREVGDTYGIISASINLGLVSYLRGDAAQAAALHKESLLLARQAGYMIEVAEALEGHAEVDAAQGQITRAARLFGAAEVLREAIGAPLYAHDRAIRDRALASVRAALGEEAFATARMEGRAMPLEEAIALALGEEADPTLREWRLTQLGFPSALPSPITDLLKDCCSNRRDNRESLRHSPVGVPGYCTGAGSHPACNPSRRA
jgi:tetratricopeptide (TPR) repeat protein